MKKLCGRKRRTTKLEDDHIAILAKRNSFTTARDIKEKLELNISTRTVQRRLNESGLKSTFAKKKPLLRAANRKICLNHFGTKLFGQTSQHMN